MAYVFNEPQQGDLIVRISTSIEEYNIRIQQSLLNPEIPRNDHYVGLTRENHRVDCPY